MTDIDDIDRRILRILEKEGRISNAELADRVNLSASACLRRVQELERSGVIEGYRATLNRKALNKSLAVYVTVGLSRHLKQDQQAFERAMSIAPEVSECHNISGTFEYLLRVETADLESYKTFHTDTLGTVEQVATITSHFVMGTSKDERG